MKAPDRIPLVGYLVSHPIQYQAPLFRRLADELGIKILEAHA